MFIFNPVARSVQGDVAFSFMHSSTSTPSSQITRLTKNSASLDSVTLAYSAGGCGVGALSGVAYTFGGIISTTTNPTSVTTIAGYNGSSRVSVGAVLSSIRSNSGCGTLGSNIFSMGGTIINTVGGYTVRTSIERFNGSTNTTDSATCYGGSNFCYGVGSYVYCFGGTNPGGSGDQTSVDRYDGSTYSSVLPTGTTYNMGRSRQWSTFSINSTIYGSSCKFVPATSTYVGIGQDPSSLQIVDSLRAWSIDNLGYYANSSIGSTIRTFDGTTKTVIAYSINIASQIAEGGISPPINGSSLV